MRAEIKPKVGYIAFASNIAKSLDFDTAVKIPTGVCCHDYARLVYRNVRAIYAKVEDSNRRESIVERLRELIENCIDGMAIWFFAASPINHSMSATYDSPDHWWRSPSCHDERPDRYWSPTLSLLNRTWNFGGSDMDLIVESQFRCFVTSPALSIVLSISGLRHSKRHNYSSELCRNWRPITPILALIMMLNSFTLQIRYADY